PAMKTIPKYINMFPAYSGFLTNAYGPDVHSFVAPTFLVRVSPPACETAHILIRSPATSNVAPPKKYVFSGLAKYIIIAPRGIGV
ncbi:uncharacterized protein METZ01_LOCUS172437, partial [marine metagenome]